MQTLSWISFGPRYILSILHSLGQACAICKHASNLTSLYSGTALEVQVEQSIAIVTKLQAGWLRRGCVSVLGRAMRFVLSYPLVGLTQDLSLWSCDGHETTYVHLYPVYPSWPVISHTFWHPYFLPCRLQCFIVLFY